MIGLPDLKTPLLWLLGVLLVAALGVAGIERTQVLKARHDTAQAEKKLGEEKLAREKERGLRIDAALRETRRFADLQTAHNNAQQKLVDDYELKLKTQAGRAAAAVAAADGRVRDFAAFAARDREAPASDAAARQRIEDRSDILAGLAGTCGRLLAEGQGIVEGRDAEVGLLVGITQTQQALLDGIAGEPGSAPDPAR